MDIWKFRWWLADHITNGAEWISERLRYSRRTRILAKRSK